MGETLNKLGEGLRLIYRGSLEYPMNWKLIDAFAKLEEVPLQKPVDSSSQDDVGSTDGHHDNPTDVVIPPRGPDPAS
jgi:hypothetical protein